MVSAADMGLWDNYSTSWYCGTKQAEVAGLGLQCSLYREADSWTVELSALNLMASRDDCRCF